jgi:transcription elongation factor Elf1
MPTFAVSLSRYSLLHQTLRIPPTSRAERPPPTSIMGKRKKSSRGPVGPKRKDPLPSTFTCLFCNHENSVIVKLDKKAGVGQLDCRLCGQQFQCAINYLSAPVDVYGEWVDAADAVAKGSSGKPSDAGAGRAIPSGRIATKATNDDDEDERRYEGDDIVADDDDDDDEY